MAMEWACRLILQAHLFADIPLWCGGSVAAIHTSVDFPDADRQ
jgi:hypothetical protein